MSTVARREWARRPRDAGLSKGKVNSKGYSAADYYDFVRSHDSEELFAQAFMAEYVGIVRSKLLPGPKPGRKEASREDEADTGLDPDSDDWPLEPHPVVGGDIPVPTRSDARRARDHYLWLLEVLPPPQRHRPSHPRCARRCRCAKPRTVCDRDSDMTRIPPPRLGPLVGQNLHQCHDGV